MRIVIEIINGCVSGIVADESCDVLVIDRDEFAEEILPDGEPGYARVWDVSANPKAVEEDFKFAGFIPS